MHHQGTKRLTHAHFQVVIISEFILTARCRAAIPISIMSSTNIVNEMLYSPQDIWSRFDVLYWQLGLMNTFLTFCADIWRYSFVSNGIATCFPPFVNFNIYIFNSRLLFMFRHIWCLLVLRCVVCQFFVFILNYKLTFWGMNLPQKRERLGT